MAITKIICSFQINTTMNSLLATMALVILSLLHPLSCVAARDHLTRGASIAVEDHVADVLRSPDGTFACGFYNVSPTVFTFSIWFARSADRTVVWSANGARPVHSTGSRLALHKRGALVLTDYNGEMVWNSTAAPTSSLARLQDSGNLVLVDPDGNIQWQSFDYPTDTLLPTQRITASKHLVSSNRLLACGYYSLGFSDYAMLSLFYDNHNVSSIYWPNPYNNYVTNNRKIYNFSRDGALNTLGQFLASDNANFMASDLGDGVKRRLTLDTDGNLRLYSLDEMAGTWMVSWMAFSNPCIIHGVCGANAVCLYAPAPVCVCAPGHERVDTTDWSRGCRPVFRYDCARAMKVVVLRHTDFWGYDLSSSENLSLRECSRRCMKNCACVAFHYEEQYNQCFLKSVLFNGRSHPGELATVYLKVPADFDVPELHIHQWQAHGGGPVIQEDIVGCVDDDTVEVFLNVSGMSSTRSEREKSVWYYLYGFLTALLVVEVLAIVFGCWLFSKNGVFGPPSQVWAIEEGYRLIASHFRRYSYADIEKATGNFTGEIGRGRSGVVYKGVLDDERVVAVKVLQNVSYSEEEFQAELSVIGRIYHMNLVRIWGLCSEGQHRILVSEFVESGSLAQMLFDRKRSENILGWNQRFRIALGVAKGLAYLHSECLEWIVHCDVKPENILLDQDLQPKITDFGLVKLINRDGSSTNLSRIRGTRGYMAPEWVSSMPITDKVDVYSFGVVLVELVKGVRISEWIMNGVDIVEMDIRMVVKMICEEIDINKETWIKECVDCRLNGEFNDVQVKAVLELAASCLEEDRSKRPSMNSVVETLISVEDKT